MHHLKRKLINKCLLLTKNSMNFMEGQSGTQTFERVGVVR